MMNWLTRSRLRTEIRREANLLAEYGTQYGWAPLNIIWETEMGTRHQRISIEEIMAMAQEAMQQNPNTALAELPAAIMDETREEFAISLIQQYIKTLNDFISQAKNFFGARVTNFDLQSFKSRLPSLLNTEEGRRAIIEQMRAFGHKIPWGSIERNADGSPGEA